MNLWYSIKRITACIVMIIMCVVVFGQPAPDWTMFTGNKERADTMMRYALRLLRKQQLDEAIPVLRACLLLSKQTASDSAAGASLYLLGSVCRYKSQNDSAVYYWSCARKLAAAKNIITLTAAVDIDYYGFYNRLGKADSASAALNRLKQVAPLLDSTSSLSAKINMYLGHDQKHQLKYTSALAYYYTALRLFTRLKDSVNEATIYISLANSFVDLGQQDKALSYHRQAAFILTLLNRRTELINELLNITDMYYTSGQLDSGELYANKALVIAKQINDKDAVGYVNMNLGNIYKRRGRFSIAEDYLLQSLAIAGSTGNDNLLIECNQGLGELYMASRQPAKAAAYLEKHLALAKQNNDLQEMIEACWNLSENQYALHHFEKAYDYKSLYSVYRDSSFRASSERSNAEMEAKYQAEKKERQIELLKKDQAIRQAELQKEKAVRAGVIVFSGLLVIIGLLVINRYRVVQKARRMVEMEKLRNDIARDLHDDIGSALSSININSNLALTQANEQTLVKAQLEKIRINSRKIMESMSDIVWAIHPGNDSMENLLVRMKEFLMEILEPLDIQYSINETRHPGKISISVDKRKEIYLIFKEAVNNAAKYSRCKNMQVFFNADPNKVTLQITDDGTGFTDTTGKRGNGLNNMQQRAVTAGGLLKLTTRPGAGTSIVLSVPVT